MECHEEGLPGRLSIGLWLNPWRPSNPWHELYTQLAARHGKNAAKSAVARKVLIAAWHVLPRDQPFKPSPARGAAPVPARSCCFLAA